MRTAEGNTYSPVVQTSSSTVLPHYGFVLGLIEVPPAKIPAFYTEFAQIVADMRAHPVSADELARAKEPIVQGRMRDRLDNGYWLEALTGVDRDPRKIAAIRMRVTGIEQVQAADVQHVVDRYLAPESSVRATIGTAH